MNTRGAETLWQQLQAADLVVGEPATGPAPTPWFVRTMLGVAGWIGALFLLLFVGIGLRFVVDSAAVSFVVGVAACAAAAALFRSRPHGDFATQFGLAVSLAGQGLVLYSLASGLNQQTGVIASGVFLFQAVLFVLVPNFVHRVWSASAGAAAVFVALADLQLQALAPGLFALACAWVWLAEFRHAGHGTMLRAGGYGLVLALIGATAALTWSTGQWLWRSGLDRHPMLEHTLWIGAGLGGLALLWAVWRLLLREAVAPTSPAGIRLLAAATIIALASLKAPGLAPATLILLLGHANGNRVLAGLGVTALLGYLSFYYYSLEATLLYKSALMVATGSALLVARMVLHACWPAPVPRENEHA